MNKNLWVKCLNCLAIYFWLPRLFSFKGMLAAQWNWAVRATFLITLFGGKVREVFVNGQKLRDEQQKAL